MGVESVALEVQRALGRKAIIRQRNAVMLDLFGGEKRFACFQRQVTGNKAVSYTHLTLPTT